MTEQANTDGRNSEKENDASRGSRGMTRRQLCAGVGAAAAMMALGGAVKIMPTTPAVRPPGGQDETALAMSCIRCQKCYEVCPRHVIAPSHIEGGILQMRTPVMNFNESYCDFCAEGNGGVPLCVECCPTNALSLPEGASPQNTIMGKAVIKREWCLAYNLIGCKFCYDACPYGAMGLDSEGRPYVIKDKCNGCGACESVCVSLQNGSIASGADSRAIVVVPE